MTIELKQHYVAFLDVLGFSEMVNEDSANESHIHLSKLYKCHQSAAMVFSQDPSCSITQFSDSIVISKPYDKSAFESFAINVAQYQRLLLDEELLCRGGIAVNKHFTNGTFTFSAGLIDAYKIESMSARYPRVVVSTELLDLLYPNLESTPKFLVKENDGLLFVDYLGITKNKKPKTLENSIKNLVNTLSKNKISSVREKGLWLASYSDAILETQLKEPQFKGAKVRN